MFIYIYYIIICIYYMLIFIYYMFIFIYYIFIFIYYNFIFIFTITITIAIIINNSSNNILCAPSLQANVLHWFSLLTNIKQLKVKCYG